VLPGLICGSTIAILLSFMSFIGLNSCHRKCGTRWRDAGLWAVYMLESRSCKYDDVFYEKHCLVSFSTVGYSKKREGKVTPKPGYIMI